MVRTPLLLASSLLIALFAGQALAAPGKQASRRPNTAEIAAGRVLYLANCAQCHGAHGEGNAPGPAPALHRVVQNFSRNAVIQVIKNGNGYVMPSFEDQLKPAEIQTLVDFVATL